MSILGRLVSWRFKLPPAITHDVIVDRDLRVPMRDGTVLLADHYHIKERPNAPSILVRSPYGRAGLFGLMFARSFAERGFQVLIQSCRGTFGSGGEFDAFRNEQSDGTDTLEWLKKQPWFSGELGTVGASYLGLVQWAVAAHADGMLKAMGLQITGSFFRDLIYTGESFGLETALTWIQSIQHQEESLLRQAFGRRKHEKEMREAAMHLPLQEADRVVTGGTVKYYQDWLEHNGPNDEWWKPVDFSGNAGSISAPVNMVGGWYDMFVPDMLADYKRLREAGGKPYLTIGPWAHTTSAAFPYMVRESLNWFRTYLLGEKGLLRKAPVRVYVMGANKWRDMADWPPAGYGEQRWFLRPGKGLSAEPPGEGEPDRYRYDPADPTPSVGGSSLSREAGPKDNRAVEAREDMLVYSSEVLEEDVEVIGAVRAELFVRSSLEHTDFFVRLCDVDPKGKSVNISDGLVRLTPGEPEAGADGVWKVGVEMWATAHRFLEGHRIRVQVAGGSHPRYARNTGTGEALGTAVRLVAAQHTVYHDAEHPSAIVLPVRRADD